MAEDRKCAHAGCGCLADPGSDYCSPECERSNGSMGAICGCNHEICRQGQPVGPGGLADGSYDPEMSREVQGKPLLDDWGKSDKH